MHFGTSGIPRNQGIDSKLYLGLLVGLSFQGRNFIII